MVSRLLRDVDGLLTDAAHAQGVAHSYLRASEQKIHQSEHAGGKIGKTCLLAVI